MTAFGVETTTDDVLAGQDLTGKRYVVTGASSGLGLETARALVAHGATVVGTMRGDPQASVTATMDEAASHGGGRIDWLRLDLGSMASVRAASDALIAEGESFDAIIANAGIMAVPFGRTADGFEQQFGVNHLGHFLLVNRLAPMLRDGGRVVVLSSAAHRFSDVDLADPNFIRTPYDTWTAYGRSKTANVLFTVEFDRRLKDRGVRALAVHPGGADTGLKRHMTEADMEAMVSRINSIAKAQTGAPAFKLKTVSQAAATSVWGATIADADEIGGKFCQDCAVAPLAHADVIGPGVREYAIDPDSAEKLWTKSEELVGERF